MNNDLLKTNCFNSKSTKFMDRRSAKRSLLKSIRPQDFSKKTDKELLHLDFQPNISNIIKKKDDNYYKDYKYIHIVSSLNRKKNLDCKTSNTNFIYQFNKTYNNVSSIRLSDFIIIHPSSNTSDTTYNFKNNHKILFINATIPYKNPEKLSGYLNCTFPLTSNPDYCGTNCYENCAPCVTTSDCVYDNCCITMDNKKTVIMSESLFGYIKVKGNNDIEVIGEKIFNEQLLNNFNEIKISILDSQGCLLCAPKTNTEPTDCELDFLLMFEIIERINVLDNSLTNSRTGYNNMNGFAYTLDNLNVKKL